MLKIILFTLFISTSVNAQSLKHKIYGYAQMDWNTSSDSDTKEGFQLKRVNLINDILLTNNSRFLADVEFEEGTDHTPSSNKGTVKVSRAFYEHSLSQHWKFQAGKVLTPYGLLNETHDFSIIYLPVNVPLPYRSQKITASRNARLYSKYTTGLSFNYKTSNHNRFWDAQLSIGNGSQESDEGTDVNNDKSVAVKQQFKWYGDSITTNWGTSHFTEGDSTRYGGIGGQRMWSHNTFLGLESDNFQFNLELFYSKFNTGLTAKQESASGYSVLGYNLSDSTIPYLYYAQSKIDLREKEWNSSFGIGLAHNISPAVVIKGEWIRTDQHQNFEEKAIDDWNTTLAISF
ncbi:MAG: hypothetical protein COW00_14990 [Bdellovibrio sp. CG12_big_fil_rev_8_21_14_0_65_39_13]|nr:MAG: hypothetical protein COW78_00545 [Bdellovibrio sp. CG22_combo_CG10-13_8_21_14_all_39_27]PIQ58597.1 MAG: hypothetical protein COW00_14990 [Bdellovibrio sp. CG12_big_fil_rev_8_21_14_0_65_39_13]PIR33805.1 MAG: hypothetical protein COV37_14950 [Bdellovibrio sp. CG11_big_fil_rev_8_21_14_0_20_39_38]